MLQTQSGVQQPKPEEYPNILVQDENIHYIKFNRLRGENKRSFTDTYSI